MYLRKNDAFLFSYFNLKEENLTATKTFKCRTASETPCISGRLTTLLLTFVKVVVARKNSIFHFMI